MSSEMNRRAFVARSMVVSAAATLATNSGVARTPVLAAEKPTGSSAAGRDEHRQIDFHPEYRGREIQATNVAEHARAQCPRLESTAVPLDG